MFQDLQHMQLKGHLPKFIKTLESDSKFSVRLLNILSDQYNQEKTEVLQGSIILQHSLSSRSIAYRSLFQYILRNSCM